MTGKRDGGKMCANGRGAVAKEVHRIRCAEDGYRDVDGTRSGTQLARQARLVSVVIAATMILWMVAQWLGGQLGLPPRYVFLFDLLALAGFFWALMVTWQIWRKRATE